MNRRGQATFSLVLLLGLTLLVAGSLAWVVTQQRENARLAALDADIAAKQIRVVVSDEDGEKSDKDIRVLQAAHPDKLPAIPSPKSEPLGYANAAGQFAAPGMAGRSGATRESALSARGAQPTSRTPLPRLFKNAAVPGDKPQGEQPKADPKGVNLADGEDGTEAYEPFQEQAFQLTSKEATTTFSADVNTASYSNIRRMLRDGTLPPKDAVRVAELINYFDYVYPKPKGDDPVGIQLELAACPWNPESKLLRVALKAKAYSTSDMPPRNLVFLVDTSGSMNVENKLPLAKESLKLLAGQLRDNDHASIVTYAGDAGTVIEPTSGKDKAKILAAIDTLGAGGSTNGTGGMSAAYDLAKRNFQAGAINRVIMMTDGDFNVGISDPKGLENYVTEKRKTGVFLTLIGFGIGNLKDQYLETLARHGNGHYAYIDTLDEARKLFVDQGGALVTVAKDVKLQVEFDPKRVKSYRLIGYENRRLKNEDFRDDAKDAGEMGSGHTVTALFEVVPAEKPDAKAKWLTARMRYKQPDGDVAQEIAEEVGPNGEAAVPSADFRFASAVTAWGMLLRDSEFKDKSSYDLVINEATAGQGPDLDGLRKEFIGLARTAKAIPAKK